MKEPWIGLVLSKGRVDKERNEGAEYIVLGEEQGMVTTYKNHRSHTTKD